MTSNDFHDFKDETLNINYDTIDDLCEDEKNKSNLYRVLRRRKLEEILEAKRFEASLDSDINDMIYEE